jgi:hypothetical protein
MEKLTNEQAEAMLATLSQHFGTPVMPVNRYCERLETWARCMSERALRLQKELFPDLSDAAQHEEHYRAQVLHTLDDTVPGIFRIVSKELGKEVAQLTVGRSPRTDREAAIDRLMGFETAAHQVERVLTAVHKSNLLARILYSGETLRAQMCPEHKGEWSGIEWADDVCPHGCQFTGWLQEEADQGKPLPGVQGVRMVPTGEPGEVTMIRDVNGEVLGKVVMHEIPKFKE